MCMILFIGHCQKEKGWREVLSTHDKNLRYFKIHRTLHTPKKVCFAVCSFKKIKQIYELKLTKQIEEKYNPKFLQRDT